jgi:2-methylcitrate dehydratase
VTIAGYVTPLVAGKLLGLNQDQLTHAVGISGSHNHALADLLGEWWRGTGQISMMKAIGYGFGSQSGIIAALLAQKGFTGPNTIIESFSRAVAKEENLAPIISGGDRFKILDTSLKAYPSEYLSQSSLDAMFDLVRKHNIQAEDVESIHIKTHSYVSILIQPSSYKPETRESADHSLPYCLAVGLIEGELGPDQFKREQWKDPKVLDLMSRIKIEIDKELSTLYPPARPVILEIRIKNGESYKTRVDYPRGDPHNPMTDQETEAKFKKLAGNLIQESQMREIIDLVNHIEEVSNVSELMEHLVV